MEQLFETDVTANIIYKEGETNYLVVSKQNAKDLEESVNAYLIKKGLALLNEKLEIPQDFQIFNQLNKQAKE